MGNQSKKENLIPNRSESNDFPPKCTMVVHDKKRYDIKIDTISEDCAGNRKDYWRVKWYLRTKFNVPLRKA